MRFGKGFKGGGQTCTLGQAALVVGQIRRAIEGQLSVMTGPDQVFVQLQRWVDIVQRRQLPDLQRGIEQQVHTPAANLLKGLVAPTGTQHVHLDPQLAGHLLQQLDIGANQVLWVLRVLPGVGRRIRAAGRHQALALACCHCRRRQQRRHARQHPACFAKPHAHSWL
ncbi:hypothetical protein D3C76_1051950 [compost metagenome]